MRTGCQEGQSTTAHPWWWQLLLRRLLPPGLMWDLGTCTTYLIPGHYVVRDVGTVVHVPAPTSVDGYITVGSTRQVYLQPMSPPVIMVAGWYTV